MFIESLACAFSGAPYVPAAEQEDEVTDENAEFEEETGCVS
jgi:hypothetical protein